MGQIGGHWVLFGLEAKKSYRVKLVMLRAGRKKIQKQFHKA